MGQVLTINSEEAASLATRLAALRGESVEDAVVSALTGALESVGAAPPAALDRDQAARERAEKERADETEYQELKAIVDDIRRHLRDPLPDSDHSWLYDDETGLPR